ncbi:hypothetical protein E1264_18460 [Actinomadura sp. KC216]|uniref:hypothetical protein n=1 Tax=Actinomadura sp. KC216 TaxID=2530370 RepID=UPI00104C2913|nr:hypothetical protein [Actinomadura sp. KC216]TDB86278.1 hypothetical protein E1264_18460 [Actinomadura sp. KC216]
MAKYKVTTPAAGHTGLVGKVHFVDGAAEVDGDANPAELAYFRAQGYGVEEVSPRPDAPAEATETGPFDPSKRDVQAVLLYLDGAGEAEALRVLDAEADGKARKGILDHRDEILTREREAEEKETAK